MVKIISEIGINHNGSIELAKELIERSQKHLKNINEIEDIHLKDEVWEHLAKNLDTLVEGLTNGVLSVQGRLVK